jgi:alkanesulfonate monooxygenase SsuD/methylene tetrahydromethanopterin reductase-like flavin-dependent oxidoreductase (luciferase family)
VHDRKFRFAVIAPKCGSGKELTEQARKAEALGYSSFFVPDHFIEHDLAPTVALAHIAAVTETLRVGPLAVSYKNLRPHDTTLQL